MHDGDIQTIMDSSVERLKSIVNSMPSSLITVLPDLTIKSWNRFIAQKTKIPANYAIGRQLNLVFPAVTDYIYLISTALRTHTVQAINNAKIIVDAQDLHRLFHITVYPIPVEQFEEAVIRIDDITDLVKSESDLAQIEKLASVGASVAGVAHEINNPLSSIMQSAQNILRRVDPQLAANKEIAAKIPLDLELQYQYLQQREIIEFLNNIHNDGERCSVFVKNMLKFTRRSPTTTAECNLLDIINAGIKLAETESNVQEDRDFKDVIFIKVYPPKPPMIECDPLEIEQVIVNIIRNSVEALVDKSGKKQIKVLVKPAGQDKVIIEITDNGPGISAENIENIFQPFFTTKQIGKGTGLGLSICKNIIVQHHHGLIAVDSKPGEYTKFTITLPVKQS